MRSATVFVIVTILLVSGSWGPDAFADDHFFLVANKKRTKKKKKFENQEFGMDSVEAIDDNDSGVGIHREQEGVDTPYVAEVAGATELALLTKKTDDNSEDLTSVSSDGHICFRFGKVFVGPELGLSYGSLSRKVTDGLTGEEGTDEVQTVSVKLGPLFRFYFANVDRVLTLPFIYSGAAYAVETTTTKPAQGDSIKASYNGFEFKAGAGMTLMMDSNIGLAPKVEYYSKSLSGKPTAKAEEEVKISTSGVRILLELMTFL